MSHYMYSSFLSLVIRYTAIWFLVVSFLLKNASRPGILASEFKPDFVAMAEALLSKKLEEFVTSGN
jgi:hypothetical protein